MCELSRSAVVLISSRPGGLSPHWRERCVRMQLMPLDEAQQALVARARLGHPRRLGHHPLGGRRAGAFHNGCRAPDAQTSQSGGASLPLPRCHTPVFPTYLPHHVFLVKRVQTVTRENGAPFFCLRDKFRDKFPSFIQVCSCMQR